MRLVNPADCRATPWKNGGGTTIEIASWPRRGRRVDWRVSLATIDRDGPFSAWPGFERTIAIVDGEGVLLDCAGATVELRRATAPWRFDGGNPCACRLIRGPVRALNLMVRRESANGDLLRVAGRVEFVDRFAAAVCLTTGGPSRCRVDAGDGVALAPGGALVVDGNADGATLRVEPSPGSTVAWVATRTKRGPGAGVSPGSRRPRREVRA